MKKVVLKTAEIVLDGKKQEIKYRVQIAQIMRTPTKDIADMEEIRKSLRVLAVVDLLTDKDKSFTLEDADFDYMCAKIKATKWPIIDQAILTFIEDITTPQKEEPA